MTFEPFRTLTSRTLVLPEENIDTDQIIPARFLTTTDKNGLGEAAFHDWRYGPDGVLDEGHILNSTDTGSHQVLVAGDNFGCGSSREHAPWALLAYGLRAVISTSIADIFRSNSLKNGLLPVVVSPEVHKDLLEQPGREVTIDLDAEELRFGNHVVPFSTEPFARRCLLEGNDPLGVLLNAMPEIEAFEEGRAA
ncbi:3-isopropylmalate dehydratase small subunit [Parvularcula dongshanensis]|uniref:3-isopropylmalate dehydratase n=1 Tax=Parvularcula dongshanensis TaxID=1173995 RepID=A0A840I4D5_9PROT|nr:3-isopropylmalate dehydratase small subunit [Parvularcula dongshanensis]MBB4658880.1 3-isopropylmalate/(R)-2-methylmalate dehydratase small subunit [Parvularcula dongshanensis]